MLFVTDFLDVTLDLQNESQKPYRKSNAHTVYMNCSLNHQQHEFKHIPVAVNSRLQKISSIKSIFKETTKHYLEAIRARGYDHKLAYCQKHEKIKKNKRGEEVYNISILQSVKAWQHGLGSASLMLWIETFLKTIHYVQFLTGRHKKCPIPVCQT